MIEEERIEAIKNNVDIRAYIESRGIVLNKNGKGYIGLCPFQPEKKPSFHVSPEKKVFHCFGCGRSGNVIQFAMGLDNVKFVEAIERFEKEYPHLAKAPEKKESEMLNQPKVPEEKVRQLYERVLSIYEKNFIEVALGRDYLANRGITDAGLFTKYRVGLCNGELKEILPRGGNVRAELTHTGILMNNDYERFTGCIVFPVYDIEGNIITLYGRRLDEGEKRHVFLPNRPKGLWNIGIIKTFPEIILVEAILDGISVEAAGYPNVIALQGTQGLSDNDIILFKEYGVQKLTLLLDADEAGTRAIERLKEKLSGFSFEIKALPTPHDPNSYLMEYGAEKLALFMAGVPVKAESGAHGKGSQSVSGERIMLQPDGFTVTYGLRAYQVCGLEKGPRKLKATVRVEYGGKLHVDTLDLYSARSRRGLAQDICRIFNELPETIDADITRLMVECERRSTHQDEPQDQEPKSGAATMTEKERHEAEEFGRSPDLIKHILSDAEKCGLIGEEANKVLGYIAVTSRKRQKPLAILIISSYGAGKSLVQDTIVDFCPPEELCKVTNLSGKALFYKERTSLKHKVLAIEEGYGAEEAFYAIRNLISTGVLVTETTIKDLATGRLTTMENRVEGPTAVFYTTTNPYGDPETKSRFFITSVDESEAQTRRIQAYQRYIHMQGDTSDDKEIERIKKKHWNFQRLLQPVVVKDPYGDQLTYGDARLQGRRDNKKYLVLIEDVAFLRQMQKPLKYEYKAGVRSAYIEVDLEDIRIANGIAHEILGRSLDELTSPSRHLLMLLDDMVEHMWCELKKLHKDLTVQRTDISFTRRDIREFTGWSNPRVHRYLKELVDLEYVLVECGRNGLKYRYRLAYEGQGKKGERFMLGLASIEKLKETLK